MHSLLPSPSMLNFNSNECFCECECVCVTLLLFPVTGSNLLESFIPGRFFSLYSIKSSDKGLALPTTTMPTTMHKKFMNNKYSVSVFESHVSGFVGWEQYTAPSK